MTALELQGCIGIILMFLNGITIPRLLIYIAEYMCDLRNGKNESIIGLIGWIVEGCGLLLGFFVGVISAILFFSEKEWNYRTPLIIYNAILVSSWVLLITGFIRKKLKKSQ